MCGSVRGSVRRFASTGKPDFSREQRPAPSPYQGSGPPSGNFQRKPMNHFVLTLVLPIAAQVLARKNVAVILGIE